MPTVLSADELAAALAALPDWSGDVNGIERAVTAGSFLAGIRLVDAVAELAEEANHHPDIDIRWRTVTFRLATHSAGGVTELDLALARQIDQLAGLPNH
ncbi:MAG: 4a-hydroxytetrahydrobiopterin dehydratase [Actinobacteria bacterium 13_2_20CM_2_71_6]|nr:MAG: 4a-hydroxytetrahydrobiopterin dehydratase [Actinobacteria bacterium 13_2_20CM_2_71_6]